MMICISCAMRAMLDGKGMPAFDESPEEHMARMHPDRAVAQREREEMEKQLADKASVTGGTD